MNSYVGKNRFNQYFTNMFGIISVKQIFNLDIEW